MVSDKRKALKHLPSNRVWNTNKDGPEANDTGLEMVGRRRETINPMTDSAGHWEMLLTEDGEKYYCNLITGETSWEDPSAESGLGTSATALFDYSPNGNDEIGVQEGDVVEILVWKTDG